MHDAFPISSHAALNPTAIEIARNRDILPNEAGANPAFTDRIKIGDQWTFVAIDPDAKLVPS